MRYNCCSYIRTVKDIRSYQEEQIGIKICAFMAFSGTWKVSEVMYVHKGANYRVVRFKNSLDDVVRILNTKK